MADTVEFAPATGWNKDAFLKADSAVCAALHSSAGAVRQVIVLVLPNDGNEHEWIRAALHIRPKHTFEFVARVDPKTMMVTEFGTQKCDDELGRKRPAADLENGWCYSLEKTLREECGLPPIPIKPAELI